MSFVAVLHWAVAIVLFAATSCAGAEEPNRLRVLSYNIHHGEGADGKLDLARIARVINSVTPDLVALQEVDQGTQRTNQVDQPAELARLTGMHVAFGPNIRYQGGNYGNAVLSKHEIVRTANHKLPNVDRGEQRGVLEVEVDWNNSGSTVVLFDTHLDARRGDAERLQSAGRINDLAERLGERRRILAGDLNDSATSETLRTLSTGWARAGEGSRPTVPAERPVRQIDFILMAPAACWHVVEIRVLDEPVASDHRPLFAVLESR